MKKLPKFDYFVSILVIFICILFIRGSLKDINLGAELKLSLDGKAAVSKLDLKNTAAQRQIIVFSTAWCGQCRSLVRKLKAAGLVFNELDIETDITGAKAYLEVMGRSSGPVPVTVVDDRVFIGAQPQSIIDYAQDLNKYIVDETKL